MLIRNCTLALLPWALAAVLAGHASPSLSQIVEGTDYARIAAPQPSDTPGKIEVIEFFSYACPHCNDFYPLVSAWAAKLPHDVVFKRVAVGFNRPQWINLQRAYYALQASGELQALDAALFHALHVEHLQLYDEASLAGWVGSHGLSADQFTQAYTSFSVNNQTVQGDEMATRYGVEAIPSLAVNGTYLAMANAEHGEGPYFADLIAHTDQLIARVRSEASDRAAATQPGAARKSK